MKVEPYGMVDAAKNEKDFDPRKPVKPCYWGVEGFGWAAGFSQMIQDENGCRRWFGGLFTPHLSPVAWVGGDIDHNAVVTRRQFIVAFEEAYGCMPVIDEHPYQLTAMQWLEGGVLTA